MRGGAQWKVKKRGGRRVMEGQGEGGKRGEGEIVKEGVDFTFSVGGESLLEV